MADYQSDRTGANIDQILDNADAGNIGLEQIAGGDPDFQNQVKTGFYYTTGSVNSPSDGSTFLSITIGANAAGGGRTKQFISKANTNEWYGITQSNGTWLDPVEFYHSNNNGVTAAEAAVAIKGSKDGKIGLGAIGSESDYNNFDLCGFMASSGSTLNDPESFTAGLTMARTSTECVQISGGIINERLYFRKKQAGTFSPWQELYHTGNTGALTFDNPPNGTQERVNINSNAICEFSRVGTSSTARQVFYNGNGQVGSIFTSGTSTQFNTSSDNRLKTVIGKPTDEQINAKFDDIYDTFTLFNWKNNPDGEAVWGFLAHDVIDKGLDFGSEGEGPRNLNIGDVYETIPEETEERPIMETVTDEDGNETEQQATDENGNLLFETVVVKEAVEKRVTPAGVDQSKVTAYIVPMVEMLRRKDKEKDDLIDELLQRIEALEAK